MMLSQYLYVLNQAPSEPHPLMSFPPIILMFLIFYFLLIRPQQKRQKEHKKLVSELQKNQEVVTAGGVHGTVVQVKESSVMLRVADNVRIEFEKSSVSQVKKKQAA